MAELYPDVYAEVKRLSEEGDAYAEAGQYRQAIETYNRAWKLIPDPKNDWEASTWLLAAIGDACFLDGFFKSGGDAFKYALTCPGGLGNPFIHLRLGQCAFEKQEFEEAAEHLTRAYAIEGGEIFRNDDPRYFDFLKTKIKPPASGVW